MVEVCAQLKISSRCVSKHIKKRINTQKADCSTRIPRISRLLALAIKLDTQMKTGVIKSYTELAELGHVSQPRATQIMGLTLLAPDIQEEILFLSTFSTGRDPWPEQKIRRIASEPLWQKQREMWNEVTGKVRAIQTVE